MTITLEQAQTVAAAALAHGTEQGFNPLTVAVLDPGGPSSRWPARTARATCARTSPSPSPTACSRWA